MKKAKFSFATLLTLAMASAAIADAGAAPTSLGDGAYTAEQAEAGQPIFEQRCSSCHNADFYKNILRTWRGQPMLYLFEQVMSSMPADNPGSLMDNEYENVMAYVLQITGFPAGDTPLEYASGMMGDVEIQAAP